MKIGFARLVQIVLFLQLTCLTACGGGGTSVGGNGAGAMGGNGSSRLMGGSIQGVSLNLADTVTTFAGGLATTGWTDGTGSAARFFLPYDITTDGSNLYVADIGNGTIRKIVIATGAVTTIAGPDNATCAANIQTILGVTGPACPRGQVNGIGNAARFSFAGISSSITTDGTNLYVVDQYLIRKIVIATGAVTTFAGSVYGYLDAVGTAAKFSGITSLTTDGINLYVADFSNIRKIDIATGAVSTIAGPGATQTQGNVDGIGSAARFSSLLHGMTTDGVNLYLADGNNGSVRKIVIATGAVTTLATGLFQPQGIASDGIYLYIDDSRGKLYKIVIATGAISAPLNGYSGVNGITTDGTSLFVTSAVDTIGRIQ